MAKAIIIEGSRNVGKTHLLKSLDLPDNAYKFPFASYFNDCFKNDFEGDWTAVNGRSELSYFSLASDIAILDLIKQGHITHDILLDRNFLSTLAFGLLTKRITVEQATNQLKWVLDNYGDIIEIVYIKSDSGQNDDRAKDTWEVYNKKDTDYIYGYLLTKLKRPRIFKNNFDTLSAGETSARDFKKLITMLMTDLPR
jgi:hypothetical protein